MDLVYKFLQTVTDEFGNKIDFSNIEVDGFDGTMCVIENCADVHISERNFDVYNSDLTAEENRLLFEFAIYVQKKMKEQRKFYKDQINTQNSLK